MGYELFSSYVSKDLKNLKKPELPTLLANIPSFLS